MCVAAGKHLHLQNSGPRGPQLAIPDVEDVCSKGKVEATSLFLRKTVFITEEKS